MTRTSLYELDEVLGTVQTGISQLCAAAIAMILITQSIMRYFFDSPLFWANEIAIQLMLLMAFSGLNVLIQTRKLIGVGFLVDMMPAKPKRLTILAIDIIATLSIVILLVFFIIWLGNPQMNEEMSPTTGLPRWYFYAPLPVLLTLSLFHSVVATLKNFEDGTTQ